MNLNIFTRINFKKKLIDSVNIFEPIEVQIFKHLNTKKWTSFVINII